MNYHLTVKSSNKKTGIDVAVSTSDSKTCPDSCPLKGNGCYAGGGPMLIHWRKVNNGERGKEWKEFIQEVSKLPFDSKFRHNQAGDLPGENNSIDAEKLDELSDVIKNKRLKAWTYTHKPLTKSNLDAIKKANLKGFTINGSADNLKEADSFKKKGIPVVVLLPVESPDTVYTPEGNKVIVCPAQRFKKSTCSNCLLCQKSNRNVIVGFRAHGSSKKKAAKISIEE